MNAILGARAGGAGSKPRDIGPRGLRARRLVVDLPRQARGIVMVETRSGNQSQNRRRSRE